jgi:predicted MFS family arabinose efflux permease
MISISTVLVMMGQGVVAPILPKFPQDFGVSTAMFGLIVDRSSFAWAISTNGILFIASVIFFGLVANDWRPPRHPPATIEAR